MNLLVLRFTNSGIVGTAAAAIRVPKCLLVFVTNVASIYFSRGMNDFIIPNYENK